MVILPTEDNVRAMSATVKNFSSLANIYRLALDLKFKPGSNTTLVHDIERLFTKVKNFCESLERVHTKDSEVRLRVPLDEDSKEYELSNLKEARRFAIYIEESIGDDVGIHVVPMLGDEHFAKQANVVYRWTADKLNGEAIGYKLIVERRALGACKADLDHAETQSLLDGNDYAIERMRSGLFQLATLGLPWTIEDDFMETSVCGSIELMLEHIKQVKPGMYEELRTRGFKLKIGD